jgi:hypothetical protein
VSRAVTSSLRDFYPAAVRQVRKLDALGQQPDNPPPTCTLEDLQWSVAVTSLPETFTRQQ